MMKLFNMNMDQIFKGIYEELIRPKRKKNNFCYVPVENLLIRL